MTVADPRSTSRGRVEAAPPPTDRSKGEPAISGSGAGPIRIPGRALRLPLLLAAVGATTIPGIFLMLGIMAGDGLGALEVVFLILFALTFGWISVAFWTGIAGFVLLLTRRDPLDLGRAPRPATDGSEVGLAGIVSRTAVVMPARNEDPDRVLRGLGAVHESLDRTGEGEHFDLFLLSDTTDAGLGEAEEHAWLRWREGAGRPERLFYRRRASNEGRKAGNIAEFCERWGTGYDFMVILDADSVMSGRTLVDLVRTMEDNPDAGLIQTLPLPARPSTLFGRLLQFAGHLYSPMLATGQAFWYGDAANYWGHNAILRIRAFVEHCRLPILAGRPPLGGEILSHDFVEAALLGRGGWKTYLLPGLRGSYEEVPETVTDFAIRDRRWAQGSLQHLRLLGTRGLRPASRLHLLLGALGYLASAFWFLMLLVATAYVLVVHDRTPPGIPSGGTDTLIRTLTPASELLPPLIATTAALLFLPKALGASLALLRRRQAFGGGLRLVAGVLLEALFAVLLAPVMMLYHSAFVGGILAGWNVRWEGQVRGGRDVDWKEAWTRSAGILAVGGLWGGVTLSLSPTFFLWLTPIFAGLFLAPALFRWTGSRRLGAVTRRWGLFLAPPEVCPGPELTTAPHLRSRFTSTVS